MPTDREDWRTWLTRHGAALILFARQWTQSRADAEDAVQQGFLQFWRSRERGSVSVGYLYAAVRSAAIDITRSQRSRGKREEFVATRETDTEPSAEWFALEHVELAAAVKSALEKLPAEQREVIVMKIWSDLSFAEIADALAIKANTAAARYRYALQKLEAELAQEVARD